MDVKKRQLSFIPDLLSFSDGKGVLSKNRTRKLIWIFVIFASTCLLSYHLATLIIEYRAYLVSTVVINNMYDFEFPNITICRKQPFSSRKRPPNGIGIESAMRFWKFALNLTDSVEDQEICFEKAMSSFQEYGYEKDIYTPLLDDFHVCQYMDWPCNPADFHAVELQSHFNCIVFAPKIRRFVVLGKHVGLRIILSSGDSYGVTSPKEQFNLQEGYNVMVHDNSADILEVMPWNFVSIRLTMKKYKRQNTAKVPCYEQRFWISSLRDLIRLHFLTEKYGECNLGDAMTEEECIGVKIMTISLQRCGCLPNSITTPIPCSVKSMQSCHKLPKEFMYNDKIDKNGTLYYDNITFSLKDSAEYQAVMNRVICHDNKVKLSLQKAYRVLDRNCPIRCFGLSYDTSMTSSKWPDNRSDMIGKLSRYQSEFHFMQRQPEINHFSERNFSTILIYPSTLNVEETTQELAYPLVKLMSDFGGTIGLWIGFSFLTLVEFIEIVLTLFAYHTSRLKGTDRNVLTDSNKGRGDELESLQDL